MGPEARTAQPEIIDGEAWLAERGLEDLAGLQVEAHGGVYSVPQALVECPPFARQFTSLAADLAEVPDGHDILRRSVLAISASATSEVPALETKKKVTRPAS